MKNDLIKLANELDEKGLHKEADHLDLLIKEAIGWCVGPMDACTKKVQTIALANKKEIEVTKVSLLREIAFLKRRLSALEGS